jgi:Protein of unknown function (DUF3108)
MALNSMQHTGVLAALVLVGGLSVSASAGDQHAIQVRANYGVYWAGLHLGDVQLAMSVDGSDYTMTGEGRFSMLGGLLYNWHGDTSSRGNLTKDSPKPSLYALSYSGGDKKTDLRISFSDGAVSEVSISPKKRPSPHNIPVPGEQLRGVLDPMTGAFLHARPDLPKADLRVCNEKIPVFDGQMRFDIVLHPRRQERIKANPGAGYSGLAAVCGVKFQPLSGYRPDDRGVKFMIAHTDEIEAWLVPMPGTGLYLPYRISVPTAFGSGQAQLLSFQVNGSKEIRAEQ